VGVAVDEPRRDDEAAGIDDAPGGIADAADRRDAPARDPHVSREALRARAIDHRPALDQEIQHVESLPEPSI
jgi:hypothetical protein